MGTEKGKVENGVNIEQVLEATGGFGRFQKIFSFIAIVPQAAAAMIILSPVFTGRSRVKLDCENYTNGFPDDIFNSTRQSISGDDSVVYTSIVQEWDLGCSKKWIVEVITSCQMAGMMLGALSSSLISDRFGRKTSFMFVTLGMGIFGSIPSLAFNPASYAISRFLAGLGMGGCFVVLLCHLMEILTPKYRIITGSMNCWPIGEMILGLLAYNIQNWRHLTVATGVPIFLIFLFLPWIHESPRWLLTQRRTEEAFKILSKIAKSNGKSPPPYTTIEALQVSVLKEEEEVLRGFQAIREIIRRKDLGLHLLILCWTNITCAITFYGLSFSVKSLTGDPYLNIVYMGLLGLFAKPSIIVLSRWCGRRLTFFCTMSFASFFLLSVLILNLCLGESNTLPPMLVTTLTLLGRFGIMASWGALTCINLESFPTALRATCLGFTVFAGYFGGIAAPTLSLLDDVAKGLPFAVYSFFAVTSCCLCWFLNDMAGKPLIDKLGGTKG